MTSDVFLLSLEEGVGYTIIMYNKSMTDSLKLSFWFNGQWQDNIKYLPFRVNFEINLHE